MTCDFTYKHYEDCLLVAKSKDYTFLKFKDYGSYLKFNKSIFMRHDIDHHLELALNFAEVEDRLGIKSTYFVRLHAKNYGIFSLDSYDILKEIKNLGHEIGLHCEPSFSYVLSRDFENDFKFSVMALEHILGEKVSSISLHEPSRTGSFLINKDLMERCDLKYQAYDDKFVKEMKYISDSSARWREGCMHEFIEKEESRLCILTHPIWWFHDTPLENY